MRRVLCVLVLMCMMSTVGICELTPMEAGKQDAQRDVPRPKWFLSGCISGGLFSWVFGQDSVARDARERPEVDVNQVTSLLGKPPEYIKKYVASYQAETIRIRIRWSEYGRITGSGIMTALVMGYLILQLE